MVTDIGALQKEVGALDELKSQLFLEYVDLHSVKVQLESWNLVVHIQTYVACWQLIHKYAIDSTNLSRHNLSFDSVPA